MKMNDGNFKWVMVLMVTDGERPWIMVNVDD